MRLVGVALMPVNGLAHCRAAGRVEGAKPVSIVVVAQPGILMGMIIWAAMKVPVVRADRSSCHSIAVTPPMDSPVRILTAM